MADSAADASKKGAERAALQCNGEHGFPEQSGPFFLRKLQ